MHAEPTKADWDELGDVLSDLEWTQNQAKATLQAAKQSLSRAKLWQHPIKWLRLWAAIRTYERHEAGEG